MKITIKIVVNQRLYGEVQRHTDRITSHEPSYRRTSQGAVDQHLPVGLFGGAVQEDTDEDGPQSAQEFTGQEVEPAPHHDKDTER
ncbi:MAG TPA: hypothetical protein VLE46_17975 [Nitrospira sp.]|nr:hypothetical protein [Nitrospira sp.]